PLLGALDAGNADDETDVLALLDVLEHQPYERVEPDLLRLLLDPGAVPSVRWAAGSQLVGKISPDARQLLLDWLASADAETAAANVQLVVSTIVGQGGGEREAMALYVLLRDALLSHYDSEARLDPDDWAAPAVLARIAALANGIAYAEHEGAMRLVTALIFDARFARFARRAVRRQGGQLGTVDASSAARPGPPIADLVHRTGPYRGMPAEVWQLVGSLKPLSDDVLASSLAAVLGDARDSGALSAFPDHYLDRVITALHDKSTGDRVRAAAVVEAYALRAEPVGGAVDYLTEKGRVDRLALEGRFAEAAEAQARCVRILARRAYDDEWPGSWGRERAALDALEGAALAAQGEAEAARAAFLRAVARSPYDPSILNSAAWYRALAGFELDTAGRDAARAVLLEKRAWGEGSLPSIDTLAFVWILQRRFEEAADLLRENVERARRLSGGRYQMRMAQALAGVGDLDGASEAVLEALAREPTIADALREDPYILPLREAGRLEPLVREATDRRLRLRD
ncbi:MAG: hypothetical protein ACYTG6_16730, partial [Planctomycetota bacterium]